jgi:hypothetical protein
MKAGEKVRLVDRKEMASNMYSTRSLDFISCHICHETALGSF